MFARVHGRRSYYAMFSCLPSCMKLQFTTDQPEHYLWLILIMGGNGVGILLDINYPFSQN